MRRTYKVVKKVVEVVATAVCVCVGSMAVAAFTGDISDSLIGKCAAKAAGKLSAGCVKAHTPVLTFVVSDSDETGILDAFLDRVTDIFPLYKYELDKPEYQAATECDFVEQILAENRSAGGKDDDEGSEEDAEGGGKTGDEDNDAQQEVADKNDKSEDVVSASAKVNLWADMKSALPIKKLNDFDYLIQNFYVVDKTTTIKRSELKAEELLKKDMSLTENVDGPQILIYHTHSQERYLDSKKTGTATSVVGLGDYLAELLEEKYGLQVLHHRGQYDVEDRDAAYSEAAPALEKLLKENPTIEVVIDLHRDAVDSDRHLITTINGKETAQIMFFNGLSRTNAAGDIAYLENPNREMNLAFSLQMQLAAATYYPGFTRPIYLKGYRYNMHYVPKSLLVEVGAQTNTFEEAKNAMEPLADLLYKVLTAEHNRN